MQSRNVVRVCVAGAAMVAWLNGQTTKLDLRTQTRNVDFGAAPSTRPAKVGTALPPVCVVGDLFFKSDAPVSQNLYGCTAADTWTLLAGGGGGGAPTGGSFITTGTESGLTSERIATAGFGIALADGGANNNLTVTVNTADVPSRARVQSGQDITCVDTGSTDSYACAPQPAFTAYDTGGGCTVSPGAVVEICTGATLVFKANTSNTGGAAFAPNGLAAKSIQKNHDQPLADGDIKAGQLVMVTYDQASDTWKMQSQTGVASGGGGGSAHALLSATHTDTTGGGAEARGDVLRRGASAWERVGLGASNRYLKSNGTDVAYSTNPAAGTGSCSGQFARSLNADAAPTCEAIAVSDLPVVISTAGQGVVRAFGYQTGGASGAKWSPTQRVWAHQFVLPYRATLSQVTMEVMTASGTGCAGGVCGFRVGIWNADRTTLLAQSVAITSGGSPDLNATGMKAAALASTVTLNPGVYWLTETSDSTVLQMRVQDIGTSGLNADNAGGSVALHGFCANSATGNGSALAFPSTCGTVTASTSFTPVLAVFRP